MVTKKSLSALKMAYISLGAVLIALCSWISVPATVPFTLQTFAVLLVCDLLGGRWGLVSVLLYLLLGAVGYRGFVSVEMARTDLDTVKRTLDYVAEVFQ